MNQEQFLEIFEKVKGEKKSLEILRELILNLGLKGRLSLQNKGKNVDTLVDEIDKSRRPMKKADRYDYSQISTYEDWLFQIPTHWKWVHLGRICDFGAGRTPARPETKYWQDGKLNWVSISDINHGGMIFRTAEKVTDIAKKEVFKAEPLPVGTVIMSFKLTIGKICRLGVPAYTNEAIVWLKPYHQELINFLFVFLPLMAKQGKTKAAVKGATLNRNSISKIQIPLPPLEEQKYIVAKVDELMALCDQLEASLDSEEAIKADLLKSLVV